MKKLILLSLLTLQFGLLAAQNADGQGRLSHLFNFGWKFHAGDLKDAYSVNYDDSSWRVLDLPHDFQIEQPWDKDAGGARGFKAMGTGWYRKTFKADPEWKGKRVLLDFEGIMLIGDVWVNGQKVGSTDYGYIGFETDITKLLRYDADNVVAVSASTGKKGGSRWYTGGGLFRDVHLLVKDYVSIARHGVFISTPKITEQSADINVQVEVEGISGKQLDVEINARIFSPKGELVTETKGMAPKKNKLATVEVPLPVVAVSNPQLWSCETPNLYRAEITLVRDGKVIDNVTEKFGIRTLEYSPEFGFKLNGKKLFLKGIANHHDLGAVGAAAFDRAIERQFELLKKFGYNHVRTSHNPYSKSFMELADKHGILIVDELIDKWSDKSYWGGRVPFTQLWYKMIPEWIKRDRNHPSVIMWSIGNEVPTQCSPVGYKVAKFLQDICHREDPTRPVTCGMDQVTCVLANGFAAMIDIPGLNYRTQRYQESYDQLPQNLILGSETASTVSSRGVYKFPVEDKKGAKYEDHQCSSYDVEVCPWSNIPDEDFALADDHHWTIGQFVWTGFDYLGEPSPYDTDSWPNHSSMFGIIDLASLPKDRYYLYRSVWNKEAETLHILPHWTWPGREGEVTPIFVYTNYPTAELFINGKSYGKQSKNNSSLKNRYRLMWMDTKYEPGEVKVVAYDKNGKAVAEKVVRTAGKPHHIELVSNRNELTADGKDLAYVTVKVVDKDGNLCPADNRQINFSVKGTGKYRAAANGDPTNLEQFHLPKMHAFNGMLTAILQAGETAGEIVFTAKANGVKAGNIRIQTK